MEKTVFEMLILAELWVSTPGILDTKDTYLELS